MFSEHYDETTRKVTELIGIEPLITGDKSTNEGDSQFPLIVGQITSIGVHSPRGRILQDLFFECVGKNIKYRQKDFSSIVSSAFQPGLMYDSEEENFILKNRRMTLKKYIGVSPEYVSLDQSELESQYLTIRNKISTFYSYSIPSTLKTIVEDKL